MCDANAPPLGVFVASLALTFTYLDDVLTSFPSDLSLATTLLAARGMEEQRNFQELLTESVGPVHFF